MSTDVFTRRWLGLFALLAGLVAILPHFLQVVVHNSGCGDVSGGCTHMGDLLTLYGRRVILAAILVPLVLAVAMRALTIGAFVWALPFALLMVAGATPLFFVAADFAATGNAHLTGSPAFTPLLFLVLLLVALSAYPDDSDGGTAVAWRTGLAVIAIAALFVTAPTWLPGTAETPYIGHFALPLALTLERAHVALGIVPQLPQFATYCMIAFILCAAGLVVSKASADAEVRPIRPMRA